MHHGLSAISWPDNWDLLNLSLPKLLILTSIASNFVEPIS